MNLLYCDNAWHVTSLSFSNVKLSQELVYTELFCDFIINKTYILSNSESVQCNFYIFDHVTFIQFKDCCCVQNFIKLGWFLSRVTILTCDIDIVILSVRPCVRLSVCPSVRDVPVSDENGLTYRHSIFSPYGSPIILVLPASNIFTKFRRGHPLRGR